MAALSTTSRLFRVAILLVYMRPRTWGKGEVWSTRYIVDGKEREKRLYHLRLASFCALLSFYISLFLRSLFDRYVALSKLWHERTAICLRFLRKGENCLFDQISHFCGTKSVTRLNFYWQHERRTFRELSFFIHRIIVFLDANIQKDYQTLINEDRIICT